MANRVSRAKVDEMFRIFVDRQSVEEVSRICGVHHATVRRYRTLERWDARVDEIRAKVLDHHPWAFARPMPYGFLRAPE